MKRLCLLLILLAVAAPVLASEFRIEDMRVDGLQRISEGNVFSFIPVEVGDVLTLVYVDGQPQIRLDRGVARGGTERLSPRIREQDLEEAITTIPFQVISAFLSKGAVLERGQIDRLPYIVAVGEGRLIGGAGNDVYVRGDVASQQGYSVVHVGEALVDPDDDSVVGYEGIFVGEGTLRRDGDPSTLMLNRTRREAVAGDRLMSLDFDIPLQFYPRPPDDNVDGSIIHVVDGISQIGQYQVVVLNRGDRHGLEAGHVLTVMRRGGKVRDRFASRLMSPKVRLPDEPAGTVMVFKTYDRISYALVMEATSEIHVLDGIRNPSCRRRAGRRGGPRGRRRDGGPLAAETLSDDSRLIIALAPGLTGQRLEQAARQLGGVERLKSTPATRLREVGLWEEEIRWERYAYGEADDPLAETPLREVPEVVGLTYRRGPGTLGVPADRLAAAAPDVAGPMLQALALDVATWRSPVETLREALGPRVDPGDWTCRPPDEAALEEVDAEVTGLTYQLGESLVAAVGWTVVEGERAALLCSHRTIRVRDLGSGLGAGPGSSSPTTSATSADGGLPSLDLGELEERAVREALARTGWHQGDAAELLGISPRTLHRKIKGYGLRRPD